MATKQANLPLQIAHFKQFMQWIPAFNNIPKSSLQEVLSGGLFEVSTCFETAIAKVCGTQVISQDEADLSCGSDAKLATVRTSAHGKVYSAPVTGIHNKIGDLLVQVYERKQEKFYYFRIPYDSYCNIPKSSNIEIPFELDGSPRKHNRKQNNPWDYECDSFLDMCGVY